MNVSVRTSFDGVTVEFRHATISFDTTVLEVVHGAETTVFPLCNVISFTTVCESQP